MILYVTLNFALQADFEVNCFPVIPRGDQLQTMDRATRALIASDQAKCAQKTKIGVHHSFDIDQPRFGGDEEWTLPIPACHLISLNGIVDVAELSVTPADPPHPRFFQ